VSNYNNNNNNNNNSNTTIIILCSDKNNNNTTTTYIKRYTFCYHFTNLSNYFFNSKNHIDLEIK